MKLWKLKIGILLSITLLLSGCIKNGENSYSQETLIDPTAEQTLEKSILEKDTIKSEAPVEVASKSKEEIKKKSSLEKSVILTLIKQNLPEESTSNKTPKKEAPKKTPPKKISQPKKESPKHETQKKSPPVKQKPPKKEAPKKEAPKKISPKQESPKKEQPKKAPPKNQPPKKESPKKTSPKKPVLDSTTVITTSGKKITIDKINGGLVIKGEENKIVLLEMYGWNCPHCIAAIKGYNKFKVKYPKDVYILTIESYGTINNVGLKQYVVNQGIKYDTVAKENSGKISSFVEELSGYNVKYHGVPALLIFSRDGTLVDYLPPQDLPEAYVDSIIQGLL